MSRALGRALWRHNQIVIISLEVRVILGNNLIQSAKNVNGEDGRRGDGERVRYMQKIFVLCRISTDSRFNNSI